MFYGVVVVQYLGVSMKGFTVVPFILAGVIDHSARHKLSAWVIDCSGYRQLFAHCRLY